MTKYQYELAQLKKQQKQLEGYARPKGDQTFQIKLRPSEVIMRDQRLAKVYNLNLNDKMYNDEKWVQTFYSSNVWKFKTNGNGDLMVAFLNGSVYIYFGVAKLFIGMLATGSKGKFVWRNLRRKAVAYQRIR